MVGVACNRIDDDVVGVACNRIDDDDDGKPSSSTNSRSPWSSLVSISVQKKGYNYMYGVGAAVQVAL